MGIRSRIHQWWALLRSEHSDPPRFGAAVALGVFIGVVPIYGFQIIVAVFLSRLFRINTITVVAAAHISTPPIGLLWIIGGVALGDWMRFGSVRVIGTEDAWKVMGGEVPDLLLSCMLGSIVIGALLGGLTGWLSYRWALKKSLAAD